MLDYKDLYVLIVDDSGLFRELLTQHLSAMGITKVEIAVDGIEATKKLKKNKFDIIFLDWFMPEKDGLSVLKECRRDSKFDNVAFIMVTSEIQTSSVIEAKAIGTTFYLMKPVSGEMIRSKVNEAIGWLEVQRGGIE